MTISVVIPYGGHDPHRERALTYVTGRYEELGYEVRVGVGDHLAWRKALAIQDATERSHGDVLVVADADCWCDELDLALAAVQDGAAWAMPYRQVWRLNEESTGQFILGDRERLQTYESHQPMLGGGIVVLRRQTYEDCPLDARFCGWGGEDQAWGFALRTLYGDPYRAVGRCWHLWHQPQTRRSRVRGSVENQQLAARYETARTNPDEMRQLIEEGRAWASNGSSSVPSPSSIPSP